VCFVLVIWQAPGLSVAEKLEAARKDWDKERVKMEAARRTRQAAVIVPYKFFHDLQ
jgi:hypothetical protein